MKFIVTLQVTAEIEERWEIEATSAEEAQAIIDDGLLHEHRFIHDKVIGEERHREVLSVIPAPSEEEPLCQCQNCDWRGPVHKADRVHDIWSRVAPGEIMPAGDCPECGALVHLSSGT